MAGAGTRAGGMIVGLGVDVVEVARIRTAVTRTPTLVGRLFTTGEQATCAIAGGGWRYGGLAARFAAKEAVGKALGTGIRGFRWLDVEVTSDALGKPAIVLHGAAAERAAVVGATTVHLSLSHTAATAVATAVAETT